MKKETLRISMPIVFVILFFFLAIIVKLGYVSISSRVDGIDLQAFTENRNTRKKTLYATRGAIYDVNGDYLAQTVNSYTLIAYLSSSRTTNEAYPRHVVDKEMTAKALSEVFLENGLTSLTYDYILSRLHTEGKYQVEFGTASKALSEHIKAQIEALNLPGIDFIASSKRYYQMGDFASYIVGFSQKNDTGDIVGKMGIESYYNEELSGENGYSEYQTDTYGYKLPNSNENTVEPTAGSSIYLTLDNTIQLFVEQEVQNLAAAGTYSWITLTVADAKTGAILASSALPSFDANKMNISQYLNPLVSYSYEPGSTMKIFSFMASIEAGLYNGSATYKSGTIQVNDATIKDFNTVGWGTIDYDTGFAYSSNVAATNLALQLGIDELYDFYDSLGFGSLTGITLPGEVKGNIEMNYLTELATASFGQGITITPIQMIQALTTIANDGVLLQPYIVDRIVDPNTGEVLVQNGRTELRQVISSSTVNQVIELMHKAGHETVTGAYRYQGSTIDVIGKTGTAQIPSSKGGYLTGQYDYIRSFAGLFPYEEPQYIIYIAAKQYTGGASKLSASVSSLVDEIGKYMNIGQSIDLSESHYVVLDQFLNADVSEIKKNLTDLGFKPVLIGNGKTVVNQYPLQGSTALVGSRVFLLTEGDVYLPSMKGWSRSEVITYCELVGVSYAFQGVGRVSSVDLDAGSLLDSQSHLTITLE